MRGLQGHSLIPDVCCPGDGAANVGTLPGESGGGPPRRLALGIGRSFGQAAGLLPNGSVSRYDGQVRRGQRRPGQWRLDAVPRSCGLGGPAELR